MIRIAYNKGRKMNDTSAIARLIKRKIEGSITAAEQKELDRLAALNPAINSLLGDLADETMLLDDVALFLELGLEKEARLSRLSSTVFSKIKARKQVSIMRRLLPYVAAVFLLSLTGISYYKFLYTKSQAIELQDIQPGVNMASITLADGRVLELSSDGVGLVVGQNLTYANGAVLDELEEENLFYAELKTPKGRQYQITLMDGTKVWLNADSKLIYPSRFEGDTRTVELLGEAYFEVSKLREDGIDKPFMVKTGTQLVKVLGTAFNVKGYPEDARIETTLVEGSVQIHEKDRALLLKPGEQAVSSPLNFFKHKVDLDQYLAWRDNEFRFYETELKEALLVLSRWYDFEIVNKGLIPDTHLYGTISKSADFAEAIKIMQSSGLKFRIERSDQQNKLIVLK